MRRMNKPSADNANALSADTRRRTKVRRAARLVYSIKQYFVAYDDDLRHFWTDVSFQIENTPCVIRIYVVCTFFTSPCVCDCVYDAVRTKSRSSVGERTRLPACHSEPIGEESRLVYLYFVLSAILRFAQEDKWGVVGVFNGTGKL